MAQTNNDEPGKGSTHGVTKLLIWWAAHEGFSSSLKNIPFSPSEANQQPAQALVPPWSCSGSMGLSKISRYDLTKATGNRRWNNLSRFFGFISAAHLRVARGAWMDVWTVVNCGNGPIWGLLWCLVSPRYNVSRCLFATLPVAFFLPWYYNGETLFCLSGWDIPCGVSILGDLVHCYRLSAAYKH